MANQHLSQIHVILEVLAQVRDSKDKAGRDAFIQSFKIGLEGGDINAEDFSKSAVEVMDRNFDNSLEGLAIKGKYLAESLRMHLLCFLDSSVVPRNPSPPPH